MSPIEVIERLPVQGPTWTWTTAGVWVLVGLLTPIVVALFKMLPAMRKLRNEADGSLRADLMKQLSEVRTELQKERVECRNQLLAMQGKMDAVVRQFVQFQITVVRWMPDEHAPIAQEVANRLLDIIATDVEEFGPHETDETEHPHV